MNLDPFKDSRESGGVGCGEEGRRDGLGGRGATDSADVADERSDDK